MRDINVDNAIYLYPNHASRLRDNHKLLGARDVCQEHETEIATYVLYTGSYVFRFSVVANN